TTTVNGGTLELVDAAITSARDYGPIAAGATLEFNRTAGAPNIGVISLSGNGTFKKSGNGQVTNVSAGSTVALGASGLFHVEDGTYQFGANGLGDWTGNLADLQVDAGATFRGEGSSIYVDALNGGGSVTIGGTSGAGALNGDGLTVGVNNGNGSFSGVISDAANGDQHSLTKVGTGTQTLSGNNTYSGTTTVNAGTLIVGATEVIPDGTGKGDVVVSSPGTLDVRFNETINGLSGNGTVDNTSGSAATLTVGAGNANSTFSGVIQDTGANLALTKTGTGTVTLTGANTYVGTTTVNGGTLELVDAAITSGRDYGPIAAGATLELNQTSGSPNIGVISLSGNGTFKKSGNGQLTNVSAGSTVALGASGLFHVEDGTYIFGATGLGDWKSNLADLQVDAGATFRGEASAIVVDALNGGGSVQIGGSNTATPTGLRGDGLTVGVNNGTGSFSGTISDSTNGNLHSLTKEGTGTQTLSGANTYTGLTSVNAGILEVDSNTALGATSGDTTVASGAQLRIIGGRTIGAGETITLSGAGTGGSVGALRSQTGANVLDGNLVMSGDATIFANSGSSLTVNGTVTGFPGGGPVTTLTLDGGGTGTLAGNIAAGAGQGAIVKNGTGAWTLSGTGNNWTVGGVTINNGNLDLGASEVIPHGVGNGSVSIANAGRLRLNGNTETINGLSGSGEVQFDGGTLIVNADGANSTFDGELNTGAGNATFRVTANTNFTQTLAGQVYNLGAPEIFTFDVESGAVADIGGQINNGNGDGHIHKTGAGELILRNPDNGYRGETQVLDGVLTVAGNDALGRADFGGTFVTAGASLRIADGVIIPQHEDIELNGTGDVGLGANTAALLIDAGSGASATVGSGGAAGSGVIVVATDATIGAFNGSTLNLDNPIDKNGTTVTFLGNGSASNTININGGVTGSLPNSDLIVDNVTTNLNSLAVYTGPTFVRNTGVLNVNATGDLSTTAITLGDSGTGDMNQIAGSSVFVSGGAGVGDLLVNPGSTYSLAGGTLDFGDTNAGTQEVGVGSGNGASVMQIDGAFSFTGGTLINVSTINQTTFTQQGGDFVIGVDGGLDVNDANLVRALTTINGNFDQTGGTLSVDIFGNTVRGRSGEAGDNFFNIGDPLTYATDSDLLYATGDIFLDGELALTIASGVELEPWGWYDVAYANGTITTGSNFSVVGGAGLFRILDTPDGQILQVAVPEPATLAVWSLLGLALAGFGWMRRRR
ncbi:MAG: autotransporter-associated beta strand repeat-containing protein, partial [Planctomycetales bacterium]|nr:autotransporter-associated beta strand repeat-containing protein [Planctomycetales bacterium]